jgi:hypothetical protein
MTKTTDAFTVTVDNLIKQACPVKDYCLLFQQDLSPKQFARLSTELTEIYVKNQAKFSNAITTLRHRIKAKPYDTMNSFNGMPSANTGSFPSFAAMPNNQPQPNTINNGGFMSPTSQPQPFNGQAANCMGPFNMNAANGQAFTYTIQQQSNGQQQFVHQHNQTPVTTATWVSPYQQHNAAQVNQVLGPPMMPDLGGQMKSLTLLRPTNTPRFQDVMTNQCVLGGIKYSEEAYKFSTDKDTYNREMGMAKSNNQALVIYAKENATKWGGTVANIQIRLDKLLSEADAEQDEQDAEIAQRNSTIQQLIADNATTEKASTKARELKATLKQIQNDLSNGQRGMLDVEAEASKHLTLVDRDL